MGSPISKSKSYRFKLNRETYGAFKHTLSIKLPSKFPEIAQNVKNADLPSFSEFFWGGAEWGAIGVVKTTRRRPALEWGAVVSMHSC